MTCPTCRVVEVSEIHLNLRDRQVTMHACVRCETRWWDQDGEPVPLDHVLALVRPGVPVGA